MTAYVIVHIDVTDPQRYPEYASQTAASAIPFDGEFLVKGGSQIVLEGVVKSRTVVIAFPEMDKAQAWYGSPEYTKLKALALDTSVRDIVVVEGV